MVTEWLLSRIRQPSSTHFHLSLSPPTSPSASATASRNAEGSPISSVFSSTEQLVQSRSFLLLLFSTSWPVDQAMARQILLATLPILTTSGREATLQNMAPTAELPLQTQVRFLWLLTTNPPAMMLTVRALHTWQSTTSHLDLFFRSPRSRFRLRAPLQSPVYRLRRLSFERSQHKPAWSLRRHTRILCTLSCVVFRTPDTHLHGGNRRHIP